ncbi:MAG: hypothetical protein ACXVBE_18395, partial [Bdellovibrionota bacterium]
MDPVKAKFFQSDFDLEHQGNTIHLRGLFSEQGITKIFLTGAVPEFWKTAVGQSVAITFDSMKITGVLIQQFVEHGTYFEIRFR